MNVKDYRRQVEERLKSARAAAAPEAALKASKPSDRGADWSAAVKQLADPAADAEKRHAALRILQAGAFLGSQFAPHRPDFLAALREVAVAKDATLRRAALDVLVSFKDEFARKLLVDGLQGAREALLAPAAALGLLARDDHASASGIARNILQKDQKDTDIHTRAQAVRLLASDPGAKELLSSLLKDKDEFREVRRASAVALRSLDPHAFAQRANEILSDHGDFAEIKATVGGALRRARRFRSGTSSGDDSDN